jgi:hypothetical protein
MRTYEYELAYPLRHPDGDRVEIVAAGLTRADADALLARREASGDAFYQEFVRRAR